MTRAVAQTETWLQAGTVLYVLCRVVIKGRGGGGSFVDLMGFGR